MEFRKRRQYVVNKALQYGSAAYVFGIVLVSLGFHTWLTYVRLAGDVRLPKAQTSLSFLLFQDLLISLVVTGVFVAVAVILGSNRIAGPLYRCEQTLKRVQTGDLTDIIKIRRGDMLCGFAEELNFAVANLRELAAEDRQHVQEAARLIMLARGGIA